MSNIFVLYTQKTRPSGKALAHKMAEIAGSNNKYAFGTMDVLSSLFKGGKNAVLPDKIVNIGETSSFHSSKFSGNVLNSPDRVARSSNKRDARILFREKGISAPDLWLNCSDIPTSSYPVVGRTTHHTRAQGFWYCLSPRDAKRAQAEGATHFLKFIPNTREFRIHIMATRAGTNRGPEEYTSIKLSEKLFSGTKKSGWDIIKNHENGWVFNFPHEEGVKGLFQSMRNLAKRSLSIFDMDWGAVDIMYSPANKKSYVLEINSSPCLTDDTANTVDKYAVGIVRLCGLPVLNKASTPAPTPPTKPAKQKAAADSDYDVVKKLLSRIRL